MVTQMESARKNMVTDETRTVAETEELPVEILMRGIAEGRVVITKNTSREITPLGIGEGLRIKVNANIGTSREICDVQREVEKARVAVDAGADTLMDLSTGGDIDEIRRRILREVRVPVGTVVIPSYSPAASML